MKNLYPKSCSGYIPYSKQIPKNCGLYGDRKLQVSKEFSIRVYGFPEYTGNGYANFCHVLNLIDKRVYKYCRIVVNGNEVRYNTESGEWFVRNWEKTNIPEYVDNDLKGQKIESALLYLERRKSRLRYQKTWFCVDLRRDMFCEDIIQEIRY